MHIVIDGYNFLKRHGVTKEIDENARSNFVSHLVRYAKKKNHCLVVVFDGGPYQWPDSKKTKGVTVIFSGERMDADQYIKEYINEHAHKHLLLITSDRELNEWADQKGVYSLDVHPFANFLYPETSDGMLVTSRAVKLSSEESRELDELMKETVPIVKQQEPRILKEKAGSLSKRERAMMEILKKL